MMLKASQKGSRVLLVLALVLVLLVSVALWQARTEAAILGAELEMFVTPVVEDRSVVDVVPLLEKQRKLRLQRFAVESRLNPIFGLAGADLDELAESVEELEGSLSDFAVLYAPEEERLLQEHFYPTEVLREWQKLEALRRTFIAAPTERGAGEYYRQLVTVLDRYDEHLSALDTVFKRFEDEGIYKGTRFEFVGGGSELAHFRDVFARVLGDVAERRRELSLRLRCFNGIVSDCTPLVAHLETVVPAMPPSKLRAPVIPPEAQTRADIVRAFRSFDSTATRGHSPASGLFCYFSSMTLF